MVASSGFTTFTGANGALGRTVPKAEIQAWRDARVDDGTLVELEIEGWPGRRWALARRRIGAPDPGP